MDVVTAAFGIAGCVLVLVAEHRRHEKEEAQEALAAAKRRLEEPATWHPGHVQARVRAIFAGVEGARAEAQACHVHGLASERGEAAIEKTLFKAGAMVPEPRRLDRVAIVCMNDQPGTALDTLHVLVSGLELRCDEAFDELWKLVRDPATNDWVLDEVTGGEAVPAALQRLTGESGVVGRA